MKLTIDPERCSGHGRCYSLVPELFESDDYGNGFLKDEHLPEGEMERAQLAVGNCPERAITLSR